MQYLQESEQNNCDISLIMSLYLIKKEAEEKKFIMTKLFLLEYIKRNIV